MNKIALNQSDYEKHYYEQIEFLKNSCNSFDNGFDGEAKRIALTLRVLIHDTRNSKSLLGLMNKKGIDFLSTNAKQEPSSPFSFQGLVVIGTGGDENIFTAMLDETGYNNYMPIENWWNEVVFKDNEQNTLTRKELILTASNQDGGAHIDPSLERKYARISKENSLGISSGNEKISKPMLNAERFAIRQIGHEVLKTLDKKYTKKMPKNDAVDMYIGNIQVVMKSSNSTAIENNKIGRNDRCPCGSGIKYKKCYSKPNINKL